jgi:16S rRNA (cytosine1402-N4)-methyltransferase
MANETGQVVSGHQSVLLSEAIESLQIQPDDTVIDATVGGAGHFSALLSALGTKGTLIGIDADSEAIERGKQAVSDFVSEDKAPVPKVELVERNFREISSVLDELGLDLVTKVLFDLGWSGYQLSSGRGFSFQTDEPLLMTYGDPQKNSAAESVITAADVVNSVSEEELANIIYMYGEEQFSRRIAKAIVDHRKREKILSTQQLVAIINEGTPEWYHHKRIHPATKTFQALRVYVNDEFGALQDGLRAAMDRLAPKGRIAVITFHSSEDRIVKNMFRDAVKLEQGTLLTKKPQVPGTEELHANPRARSAKLRVFERSEIQEIIR